MHCIAFKQFFPEAAGKPIQCLFSMLLLGAFGEHSMQRHSKTYKTLQVKSYLFVGLQSSFSNKIGLNLLCFCFKFCFKSPWNFHYPSDSFTAFFQQLLFIVPSSISPVQSPVSVLPPLHPLPLTSHTQHSQPPVRSLSFLFTPSFVNSHKTVWVIPPPLCSHFLFCNPLSSPMRSFIHSFIHTATLVQLEGLTHHLFISQ